MFVSPLVKMGGAAVLTLSLAACMDIAMDVEILSESTANLTMTTTVAPDIYAMIDAQADDSEEGFCDDGETIETTTSVSCVVTQTGPFEDLEFNEDGSGPQIVAIGGGQVRVNFPLSELQSEIGEGMGGEDPEMMAMMAAMFEGNSIAMTVSGGRIVDTNMEIAADGLSASYSIPFAALLAGELELPDEIFAVVQK